MLKMVLVVDESGAKGFSKNQEKESNEFGVMAGYLIPEECLKQARSIANGFFSPINVSGKLHLTDLTKEQQAEARELIYQVFKSNRICWFYEAIYVQGFYDSAHTEGRGGFGKDELMHSKLFSGVFIKAIPRLRHEENKQLSIHVITDKIDKKIINGFKSEVKSYVEAITRAPIKRNSEIYSIESVITLEDDSLFFNSIQYDIECEDSCITFIADVLANSTLYFLKKKVKKIPI